MRNCKAICFHLKRVTVISEENVRWDKTPVVYPDIFSAGTSWRSVLRDSSMKSAKLTWLNCREHTHCTRSFPADVDFTRNKPPTTTVMLMERVIIIIIIIITIIRYGCLLSQAFSSWYFSWTSSDPHRSGFKLHTAV